MVEVVASRIVEIHRDLDRAQAKQWVQKSMFPESPAIVVKSQDTLSHGA